MGQFCQGCGNEVEEGAAFCSRCGAQLLPQTPKGAGNDDEAILWNRKVPLISNTVLIKDLFFTLLAAAVVFGSILGIVTGEFGIFIMFFGLFIGLFVLFLIIALVLQVVTKGGVYTEFYVGTDGAAHRAGKATRTADTGVIVGSILAGSAVGAGAGLIAFSQEANALPWGDVRHISVNSRMRLVVLRSKYLINPVALYCNEDNFPRVLDAVRKYAPKGARGI